MEAIHLVCGARRSQLMGDPLGCTFLNIVSRYTTARDQARQNDGVFVPARRQVRRIRRSWENDGVCGRGGAHGEEVRQNSCGQVQPNMRMKLAACGRRLRRNAQGELFLLSAASAGRSLCAIR